MAMKQCLTCMRSREDECSHVDCPNRKMITAQASDGFRQEFTTGRGAKESPPAFPGDTTHIASIPLGGALRKSTFRGDR